MISVEDFRATWLSRPLLIETDDWNVYCLECVPLNLNSSFKKDSPYSITERRVLELIPVLGNQ